MEAKLRRLIRTARLVQRAYENRSEISAVPALPQEAWLDVQRSRDRFETARRREWSGACAAARRSLIADLDYLVGQLENRLLVVRKAERNDVPTLRTLYEELAAADAEFEGLEFTDGALQVTTESIVLEDIRLGRFQISLKLRCLHGDSPFTVTALDPNPAAGNSATTHPHVNDERLCEGEGRAAIRAALAEGRLYDFFTIVDRILHTYARGSAYVELDRWSGVACHDCDATVDPDEARECNACQESLCENCVTHCGDCGEPYCSGCTERCAGCEEPYCASCLSTCRTCKRDVCENCLTDRVCDACREEIEDEATAAADSEEAARAETESAV